MSFVAFFARFISRLLPAVLFAAATMVPAVATAQAYPTKPIRLVVPFPAGGSLDVVARAIGQKLTEAWGQPVVIDNRPGVVGNQGINLHRRQGSEVGFAVIAGICGNQ